MDLGEKGHGVEVVLGHQAREGRAVAPPVVVAQVRGLGLVQPQFAHDEGVHPPLDLREKPRGGIVEPCCRGRKTQTRTWEKEAATMPEG